MTARVARASRALAIAMLGALGPAGCAGLIGLDAFSEGTSTGESGDDGATANAESGGNDGTIGDGTAGDEMPQGSGSDALAGKDTSCIGPGCEMPDEGAPPGDAGSDTSTGPTCVAAATPAYMPIGRTGGGAATGSDGRIYVAGGWDEYGNLSSSVLAYDPCANTWTAVAPLPTPRAYPAVVATPGQIYVVGGAVLGDGGTLIPVTTVEGYGIATKQWSSAPPLGVAREALAAVVLPSLGTSSSTTILAMGGVGADGSAVASVEYFPLGNTSWTPLTLSMTTPRAFLSAATDPAGNVYAIGGSNGGCILDSVEVFTAAVAGWDAGVAPLMAATTHGGAVLGRDGQIYIVGGDHPVGNPCTSGPLYGAGLVYAYSPTSNTWSFDSSTMPTPREDLAVVTAPVAGAAKIFAIGGTSDGGALRAVEELDTSAGWSTCAASTQSDHANCGYCGHDCLGGSCQSGVCQPFLVTSGLSSPFDVAADAKNVYWTEQGDGITATGRVASCGAGGAAAGICETPATLAPGQVRPRGIAEYGGALFWTSDTPDGGGLVQSMTTTGQSPSTLASPSAPGAITVNALNVYWTSNGAVETEIGGGISALDGIFVGARSVTTNATFGGAYGSLLWTNGDDGGAGGSVASCSLASQGLCQQGPTLISNRMGPYAIANDATRVYWTEDPGGNVMQCTMGAAGCVNLTTIATGQTTPDAIATDGVYVYWTDTQASTVNACPVDGCNGAPSVLVSLGSLPGNKFPGSIAVNQSGVFWVSSASGSILGVAR